VSPVPELPVRLEVHAREPFAEAYRFTGIGAYKVLTATAHYAVDPKAAAYHAIPDLDLVRSGRSPARPFRAQRRQSTVTGWRTTASNR
jgi:hypothetical protein